MNIRRKDRRFILILVTLFSFSIVASVAYAHQFGFRIPKQVTGDLAYKHVVHLSEEIGARVAGTLKEEDTAAYIAEQFEEMGYKVEFQDFNFKRGDDIYYSQNVIATKRGRKKQTVIIGAHYDSVSERSCEDGNVLTGAGDNASGVAVMLEAASVLARYKTHGNIKFVAFGAEEVGLIGSEYYASQMTEKEIKNTVAMINLDSVGVGDHFNVYSGIDNPGWARNLALILGKIMGHDIRTSPGEPSCDFLAWGEAGDWSDHVAFKELGIPIAYFEMMNWEIEPCYGEETEEFGWVMHTCMDNLSMVSKEKLEMTAEVVAALALMVSKTKLPKFHKGKVDKGFTFKSLKN